MCVTQHIPAFWCLLATCNIDSNFRDEPKDRKIIHLSLFLMGFDQRHMPPFFGGC